MCKEIPTHVHRIAVLFLLLPISQMAKTSTNYLLVKNLRARTTLNASLPCVAQNFRSLS